MLRMLLFCETSAQIQYGTYNSIYYVINYLHPTLDTSFDLCGWRTSTIISLEVFYCKLKHCYLTCIAGGLLKDCPTNKTPLHIRKGVFAVEKTDTNPFIVNLRRTDSAFWLSAANAVQYSGGTVRDSHPAFLNKRLTFVYEIRILFSGIFARKTAFSAAV